MSSSERGTIPPEENIEFTPSPITDELLKSLEPFLSIQYYQWRARKIEELKFRSHLLESELQEGEKIVRASTLRIDDEFKIVTTYPRESQYDQVHTVNYFSTNKNLKKTSKKPHLVTTNGATFTLDVYVIVATKTAK